MRKLYFFILSLFFIINAKGQSINAKAFDVGIAAGKSGFSPATGLECLYGLGKLGKFKIGYGLRYTGFFANNKNLNFRTAPASLTSGKSSLAALFSEDIVNQIDSLVINKVQTNALNLNIRLEYSLTKKLDIGFNIDAIGVTFGGNQESVFVAKVSDNQGNNNNGKTFKAKPTSFNLLLISDSDIGSLNSELFARYWVTEKVGIRAGASFQFIEYKTEQELAFNNDRFRSKQLLPFVALSFKL